MKKKKSFTPSRIEKAVCPPGVQQVFLWDDAAKGLGLRVTSTGAKAYIFQGKLHGKTIRMTIGSPKTWPVETIWKKDAGGVRTEVLLGAREEARRLQSLLDQGIDPREQAAEKLAARETAKAEAKRKELTVGDVWPLYLAARKDKWSESHYRAHVVLSSPGGERKKRGKGEKTAGPISKLLAIRMCDLTADMLADWLEKETAVRPTAAALSYRLLRAFVRWSDDIGEYKGLVPPTAYNARKVRDNLPKSQTKEGDSLQREQLASWFGAVVQIRNPIISAYLQALLLTGARREEMAALRWTDVDFQWRSMTIGDKNDGARTIPLTPYLASLLNALPRRNEWVFSSPTAERGHIAEPRIAHNEALQVAGLPHVSLHGLRRSFGTLCEWVEMPSGISAQIMGHKPSALAEKHYRRRPLDLLRKWHDAIETWILEQSGIEFKAAKGSLHVVTSA